MKTGLIFMLAGILFLGINACNYRGNFNGKTVVDNVVLNYDNTTIVAEAYQEAVLELDLGSGAVNLMGSAEAELNLKVDYKEFNPGDATIIIKNGKLTFETKSGKPAAIMGVSGTIPLSVSLKIDTGSGIVEIAELTGSQDVRIESGSGKIRALNCELNKLQASSGSGNVDILQSTITSLHADTGSGNVSLTGCRIGTAKVSTGSGNIILQDSQIEHRLFQTGSGRVIE